MGTRARLLIGGASLALVSGAVVVLFFFQPWRSCDYEDTSVGCAMLPHDVNIMLVAMLGLVAGAVVVAAGALARQPPELGK